MIYEIRPPEIIDVEINLPASKSISNRALILKALSKSPYEVRNLSDCDDTEVMIEAFLSKEKIVDIKAAGTSMRFLTAYFAQAEGERIITGTMRMKNRPVKILVDALQELGADIGYIEKEGYPPLYIKGKKLKGGTVTLNGGISSQYISALMMIAPFMEQGLNLILEGKIISRPYIMMTITMLKDFGIHVEWMDNRIYIPPQDFKPVPYTVESDWSAASYWYEIATLSGKESRIRLNGLYRESMQGDSKIAGLFEKLGIKTIYRKESQVELMPLNTQPDKLEYDFINEPDMAQTFVICCTMNNIPFRFTGLQSLKIKETDRIFALKTELNKLGILLKEEEDSILEWNGKRKEPLLNVAIDTYEDHRMAMAFAPVALTLGIVNINEPEVVSKSYPSFWEDLVKAGFKITGITDKGEIE